VLLYRRSSQARNARVPINRTLKEIPTPSPIGKDLLDEDVLLEGSEVEDDSLTILDDDIGDDGGDGVDCVEELVADVVV